MTFHVKQDGVWKEPEVHVKHEGAWKRAEVWTKVDGVWKQAAQTVVHIVYPVDPSSSGEADFYSVMLTSDVTGGSPSSRTWGILSDFGGFWTISPSGANATVNVSDVGSISSASATIYCDAVVGGVTFRSQTTITYQRTA